MILKIILRNTLVYSLSLFRSFKTHFPFFTIMLHAHNYRDRHIITLTYVFLPSFPIQWEFQQTEVLT